ncbi:MAG: DNA-3-methyladenine glycosylase I [Desulfobacterales bacterium]
MKTRCTWAGNDPLYINYHDTEWGVPLHDDRRLFEFLILDGFQAGLSWLTILKKRENYRKAFDEFDPLIIAAYDSSKAAVQNAASYLSVQREFGSFEKYIWRFVGGRTLKNRWQTVAAIPAWTKESAAMSADLKKRGFKFVGPTICYAFMQAAGLVNDHIVGCFRYNEV